MESLAKLAPALQIGGTVLGSMGQLSQGRAAGEVARRRKAASEFEARQLLQAGEQAVSVSQQSASEQSRMGGIAKSRALALAAASGAGASDPTVMRIISDLDAEIAYRRGVALYEGAETARLRRAQASARRYEGDVAMADAEAARRASRSGAFTTLLTGGARAATMFDKYWAGKKPSIDLEGYQSGLEWS